ncbi:MAG: DUF1883 domain-containing protein [Pirellulales bacterium]
MNYLHYQFDLSPHDAIQVVLDRQANVRLLDEVNYQKYRRGEHHQYYGGLAKTTSVTLEAPREGRWHLVIDLGGYPGRVRAAVEKLSKAQA